jgi:hypothetical protein
VWQSHQRASRQKTKGSAWKTIRRDDGSKKIRMEAIRYDDGSKKEGLRQSPATIGWQAKKGRDISFMEQKYIQN